MLLDVFGADPRFGPLSRRALRTCMNEGQLVACEVVWAEVAGFFDSPEVAENALSRIGVAYSPMDKRSALLASTAWRNYRMRGGRRDRVAADFLIGAHSMLQAERLLTRDRGFYRSYFGKLQVFDPSSRARR